MEPEKKSRKKKIVIVILIIIAVLIGVWFIFLRDYLADRLQISPDNLFPFGNPSNRIPDERTPTDTTSGGGGITVDTFTPIARDRLRLVAEVAVAGFKPRQTNEYYPSQESITIYNESRGEEDIELLSAIRTPYLRHVVQSNHQIFDTIMDSQVRRLLVAETFVPNIYETMFAYDGEYFTTRLYDPRTRFIETFTSRVLDRDLPIACEIPSGRAFILGDSHPGIRGVKVAMDDLYDIGQSNTDIFDETLAASLAEFEFNLDLSEEPATTTEILEEETLNRLRTVCFTNQEDALSELPISLAGNFLSSDILEVAQNPTDYEIATLQLSGISGPYRVSQYHTIFEELTTLLDTDFGEWLIDWTNDDTITIQTKPSSLVAGHAYFLNTQTGRLDKILGDKLGLLVKTSPDERYMLYSSTNPNTGRPQTRLLNLTERTEVLLPFQTLADKCTWAPDSTQVWCAAPTNRLHEGEPDLWFQGRTQYSDAIWMTIAETGSSRQIYNPSTQRNVELDIYKMQYDPFEGNYLYFLDKNTNYLWSLEIDGLDE